MKIQLSIVLISAMTLLSCTKSNDEAENPPWNSIAYHTTALLGIPDDITGIELERSMVRHTGEMDDLELWARLKRVSYLYMWDDTMREKWHEYNKETLSDINARSEGHIPDDYFGPDWVDCGIDGEVSISADCVLFGEAAGSNLLSHFEIHDPGGSCRLVIRYPSYEWVRFYSRKDTTAIPMNEYFASGIVLPAFQQLLFGFTSVPPERPQRMTLTMRIPITYQSWDGFDWTYRSDDYVRLDTERVLEGSVEIEFGTE